MAKQWEVFIKSKGYINIECKKLFRKRDFYSGTIGILLLFSGS